MGVGDGFEGAQLLASLIQSGLSFSLRNPALSARRCEPNDRHASERRVKVSYLIFVKKVFDGIKFLNRDRNMPPVWLSLLRSCSISSSRRPLRLCSSPMAVLQVACDHSIPLHAYSGPLCDRLRASKDIPFNAPSNATTHRLF